MFPFIFIGYWWVIVTMTTVGYGDYYPTTVFGYITAAIVMMLGLMVTALPIVIIGTNFSIVSDYNKERQRKKATECVEKEDSSIAELNGINKIESVSNIV